MTLTYFRDEPREGHLDRIKRVTPAPKGKILVTVSYIDANLHHNSGTGRLVTELLNFLN